MGGESTSVTRADKDKGANSDEPPVEVEPRGGHLTVSPQFAGVFQPLCAIHAGAFGAARAASPLFAGIRPSSPATRAPASGSRKDAVPTPTISAPTASRSAA